MATEQKNNGKDLGTPIGIVSGAIIILTGIYLQKTSAVFITKLNWFLSSSALFIVLGSTIAAAMVAIPFNSIKTIPSVVGITVRSLSFDYLAVIDKMLELAAIGRKDGLFIGFYFSTTLVAGCMKPVRFRLKTAICKSSQMEMSKVLFI